MTAQTQSQRERDVKQIVGGNFTHDALGPAYNQILERLRADTRGYLDTFERLYLASPPNLRQLSKLYLPTFLEHAARSEPERARALARQLLGRVDTAARTVEQVIEQIGERENVPDETLNTAETLDYRRRELDLLASGA